MSESVPPPANDANEAREILELVHHHPGRLRLRSRALRGEDAGAIATRVTDALDAIVGVTRVAHNPQTGSVLVEYEPLHVEPDAIVAAVATAANLMSPFDPRARRLPTRPASSLIDGVKTLNTAASEATGTRVDLRGLVPAALAGAAAYAFVFGDGPRLPRWDNLLWWSYSVFTQMHAKEIGDDGGKSGTQR